VRQRVSDNQRQALDALEEAGGALGYAEWRNLSGVPKGSFARVRSALLAKELVVHEGDTYRPVSMTDSTPTDTSAPRVGASTANAGEFGIDKGNSKRTLHADAYGNWWWEEEPEKPEKTWYTNKRGDWWLA
jgi:hypothetical protein